MLVEGDDASAGLDVEASRQGAQPARVLGGDEIGLLQAPLQSPGGVGRIADRGGSQSDGPATQVRAVGGGHGIGTASGIGGTGLATLVDPVIVAAPDGKVLCGRDALGHRTQYVSAVSITRPHTLGG